MKNKGNFTLVNQNQSNFKLENRIDCAMSLLWIKRQLKNKKWIKNKGNFTLVNQNQSNFKLENRIDCAMSLFWIKRQLKTKVILHWLTKTKAILNQKTE